MMLSILALTLIVELSLALAYAAQGAEQSYMEMYELRTDKHDPRSANR